MSNYYIYSHIFPNGKVYIGLSHIKPHRRFREGKGYKGQFVYKAILKYGWENIQHKILEENLTFEEAIEREKYYIDKFDSMNKEKGYNVSYGHQPKESVKHSKPRIPSMLGKHHTEETKLKMSIAHKKIKHKPMNLETKIKNSKPVIQYDKQMNFVAEYYGITEASRQTGILISGISFCLHGRNKTSGGYIWRFKKESDYYNKV